MTLTSQLDYLLKKNITDLRTQFANGKPFPIVNIDNFLPQTTAVNLYKETQSIDNSLWKNFTRKGSHMLEFNKIEMAPEAFNFVNYMHSANILMWLESLTGIEGLIPDPYLTGAGYSKSFAGDTLKIHTDFNWNDKLKLHRALSLIIYLTPDWRPEWKGGLEFYDKERQNISFKATCLFNQCLIWKYNKYGYHGFEEPLSCPNNINRTTFRLFYYTSNSTYIKDDEPHRSLYWFDDATKTPYDIKDEK